MTSPSSQRTDFTLDVMGRYVCNGLDEANRSTDRSVDPDAKPFDYIVIGGGSFGSVFASHILNLDRAHSHRILVLEAGPFLFGEHVQNLPAIGLVAPGPTTVDPGVPRAEVWGLPWRTDVPFGFPGLAYCIGGRSLFFGGWSPELLDAEMPATVWPTQVVQDLKTKYFAAAAEQIGVDQTNDFVFGAMHEGLRQLLFDGLGTVAAAIEGE